MNRYIATIRLQDRLARTIVFADSQVHARLLLQYMYGMNSITSSPTLIAQKTAS
jgi:hypothetical protein